MTASCLSVPIAARVDYVLPRLADGGTVTFESLAGTSVVGNVGTSTQPDGNASGSSLFRRGGLASAANGQPTSLAIAGGSGSNFAARRNWNFITGLHMLCVFSFANGVPTTSGLFLGFAAPNNGNAFTNGISTTPSAAGGGFDDLIGLGADGADASFSFFTRQGAAAATKTATGLAKANPATLYFKMGTQASRRGLYMECGTLAALDSGAVRFNPMATAEFFNTAQLPLAATQLCWMVAGHPPGGASTFIDVAYIHVRDGDSCL